MEISLFLARALVTKTRRGKGKDLYNWVFDEMTGGYWDKKTNRPQLKGIFQSTVRMTRRARDGN